ncbi:MAG: ThuA domain-containing protein [bacterium]
MNKLKVIVFACAFACVRVDAQTENPVRVLLTYGGHGFDEKAFFSMCDSLPGVKVTKAEMPKQADLLKPGLEKEYDVIVMYDMASGFTPEQQASFTNLLNTGIGLVATHHNLGAHGEWPEYRNMIGGAWLAAPKTIDDRKYPGSTYAEDVDFNVAVADKKHPITKGVSDFTVHDEVYGRFYVAPDVHVLLTCDHPKCGHDIAWTLQYGKSRVFYLMLAHGPSGYEHPSYQKLLVNGIRWAADARKGLTR